MDFPFFHLYGLFVGLGIATAVLLFEKVVEKEKLSLPVDQLAWWILLPGVIGARVYHLVTDWELYGNASVWELIAIWNGGLGIIGAIVGGALGLLLYLKLKKRKLSEFFVVLDIAALCLPIGQAIGRWGNFFNQELYGHATELRIGVTISPENLLPGLDPNARYHPLFLYESIAMFLVGGSLLWLYSRKKLGKLGTGQYFGMYAMSYATTRFLLEFLRIESSRPTVSLLQTFTTAQWMMVMLFIIGIGLFVKGGKDAV